MLAGLLLQRFWWGPVFLVAVPVMVLLDSAHAAFTAGLHITGAIAAAVFAVLAVLVAASARRGAAPEPAPTADAEAEARPAVV
ncbi:hypothetical protein OG979_39205 [Actinomadura citrea]|uniref:hypothetical protein n=1 Tax=Actinomadura citrea TaxID=46158 RepID=UPI002E2BED4E|nr:hypothetical protein [Actinomadura citrea]